MQDLEHVELGPCPRDHVQPGQCGMAKKFVSVCYGILGYPYLATDHTVLARCMLTLYSIFVHVSSGSNEVPFNFR